MILVDSVTKRFGSTRAVDDVTLRVASGEAVALWGSNGAGKTTLIRCLLGVLHFRGRITIGDVNVKRRGKAARRLVGYVPQELAFHDDMRLGTAMAFFARLRRVDSVRCSQLLDRVGLAGHERKRVRDLSGGMKQRLALAVAMLADPPVIVLDEPTSNLDASGRDDVVKALVELKSEGKTVLFASHRPEEVVALADRILVMDEGRLVRDTTPARVWAASDVRTMRLYVHDGTEQSAATLLREAGHVVELNGHGLCVTVAHDQKAAPIRVLERAQVSVRDFQILESIEGEETGR